LKRLFRWLNGGHLNICRKLCIEGSLDKEKVKGKIVVCIRGKNARVEKGEAVRGAGGVGLVLVNDAASGNEMIADAHVLPATHITYTDGITLLAYLNSTRYLEFIDLCY
jgi:hypothetical protein